MSRPMASDRPLSRRLVRLAALAAGPARAHRADLWPGLRIEGERILWRGAPLPMARPPTSLLPRSVPLAVIGSGPSLRGQDLSALEPGTAILCNGAASLAPRLVPAAVAVEDERFVHRRGALIAELPPGIPLLLSPAALRALLARGMDVEGRRIGLIRDLRKPLGGRRRALSDPSLDAVVIRDRAAALSTDPDCGVVICGTVALSALQIALAIRPPRVLLAGIDLGNAAEPRFNETAGDRAPSGLAAGMDRILAGFALAWRLAERQRTALACASPVSALLGLGYPFDDALSPPRPEESGP
ncbi:glycosyl transferase [Wenxinia saemankumensis]|uniref:Uncharacterized protein n=1 Tax=Wenxinia saemankumensis TaxID=1447782 RepID=A0A1M6C431_9RHOB|nr:glycosyl transferase [Wenxinia saemankumensis]SHI55777.1 hypothetical protein SAMN05444417_0997 [Wenxinia saemankumensis]